MVNGRKSNVSRVRTKVGGARKIIRRRLAKVPRRIVARRLR